MKLKDKNKENLILQNTIDIVYEKGIAGLKMSTLAKQVGVSPSTLYVYFATKADLIVGIWTSLLEKIWKNRVALLDDNLSLEEKLKTMLRWMLDFQKNNQKEVNFIDQWKQSPFFEEKSIKSWEENKWWKQKLFNEARIEGLIKNLDDEVLFFIIWWIAKQVISLDEMKIIDLNKDGLDDYLEIIWDAIKK